MPPSASDKVIAAPPADASRVAAIKNSLVLNDPNEIAVFGERARREVVASVDRLLSEVRGRDLVEATDIMGHIADALVDLDPAVLDRKGGFFGARGRRLKRFRTTFEHASATIEGLAGDLQERVDRIARKTQDLNGLHEQTRAFILELDAYLEAGRARMADARRLPPRMPGPVRELEPTPAAASEARVAPDAEATSPADGAAPEPLHPADVLERRLNELVGARAAAVQQLPLVRIVQNVDGPLVDRLREALDAVTLWRKTWGGLLARGRGRPDTLTLAEGRARLQAALAAPRDTIAEGKARRADAEAQMEKIAQTVRKPL